MSLTRLVNLLNNMNDSMEEIVQNSHYMDEIAAHDILMQIENNRHCIAELTEELGE